MRVHGVDRKSEIRQVASENAGDHPYIGGVEAAFFDLDKTVIARASIMAFARDFQRQGLLTRRTMAKGLWVQLVYVHLGASSRKLERIRRSVLTLTRGWDQARVRLVVADKLTSAIDPITFAEARELMDEHRRAGRRVYLVSAAPAEIVEPLAEHFGADAALASVARVGLDGCYTGELECYAYGEEKGRLITDLAVRAGIDLGASYAYSDSATDLPMLETVGHPVAVNPDRALRRIAEQRGWEVRHFDRRLCPEGAAPEVAASQEVAGVVAAPESRSRWRLMAGSPGRTRAWVGSASWARRSSAAAAVAAAAGGAGAVGAVAWRYRSQLGHT